ncbi:hypothetical protein CSX11_18190 [Mycobacterium goodii]|nr:hypothetical protein CSX11_18190 [Mycolicibacterium goodii]
MDPKTNDNGGDRHSDTGYDPDADPEMLQQRVHPQPDQAEGGDDPAETGED